MILNRTAVDNPPSVSQNVNLAKLVQSMVRETCALDATAMQSQRDYARIARVINTAIRRINVSPDDVRTLHSCEIHKARRTVSPLTMLTSPLRRRRVVEQTQRLENVVLI